MRTQVESIKFLLVNLRKELEVTYADVEVPSLLASFECAEHQIKSLLSDMIDHAADEYPDGIPDTV